jgi:hypothetical protein
MNAEGVALTSSRIPASDPTFSASPEADKTLFDAFYYKYFKDDIQAVTANGMVIHAFTYSNEVVASSPYKQAPILNVQAYDADAKQFIDIGFEPMPFDNRYHGQDEVYAYVDLTDLQTYTDVVLFVGSSQGTHLAIADIQFVDGYLEGVVTDNAATPAPIEGVTVTIGGYTVTTNARGEYRIYETATTGLIIDDEAIVVTKDGYSSGNGIVAKTNVPGSGGSIKYYNRTATIALTAS